VPRWRSSASSARHCAVSGAFGHWPNASNGSPLRSEPSRRRDAVGGSAGEPPRTAIILCGTTCWSLARALAAPRCSARTNGFGAECLRGSHGVVLSALLGEHCRYRAHPSVVGVDLPRRVRFADCILRVPLRRRARIPTLAATYAYAIRPLRCSSVGGSQRNISANVLLGLPIVLTRRAARLDSDARTARAAKRCLGGAASAPANAVR